MRRALELREALEQPDPIAHLGSRERRLGTEETALLVARYEGLCAAVGRDGSPVELPRRIAERFEADEMRHRIAAGQDELTAFLVALGGFLLALSGVVLLMVPAYLILPKLSVLHTFDED